MTDSIYTEQYITVEDIAPEEDGRADKLSQFTTGDINTDEHKEVDPFAPVGVVNLEPANGGFIETEEYDPKKPKAAKKPKAKAVTKAKKKVRKKAVKVEPVTETAEDIYEEIEVEEERPLKKVVFDGVFGRVSAGYLDIYSQGVYLILVEDIEVEFSYSPPESEDIIIVETDGVSISTVSPGIYLKLPEQGIKITVLLKTGEKDE